MAAMELEHRFCLPTSTIHWISCNSSFPTLATHLMMDMHTPPLGLVFHPADDLSRIRPVAVERSFISSFGQLDSLSSTRHLAHSTRTNLCLSPQMACFGDVLLDIRHMHNVSSLCRASWSTKCALRKCQCPSGANWSCQSVRVNISTQGLLQRQSYIPQSPAGNDFWSKENAFCRSVFELDVSRKSLRPTREFFLCYEHDAPLDEPQCIWKYKAGRRTYQAPTIQQANLTITPLQYVKELAGPR